MSQTLTNLTPTTQEALDGTAAHVQSPDGYIDIKFQLGPIKEHGVNGTQMEPVLQILIDRLTGFQSGPFACIENQLALNALNEALAWMNFRTRQRAAKGVEGTNKN